MNISVGPTGSLITGDVLDVNRKSLEPIIQHYDELLYLKWNPRKNGGYGKWELRRRPQNKTVVETIQLNGITIQKIDYKENDFENHVFDLPVLSYQVLDRLRKTDIWRQVDYNGKASKINQWSKEADENFFKHKDIAKQKAHDDMIYNLKQDSHILEDFREKLRSGVDPKHLLRFWK